MGTLCVLQGHTVAGKEGKEAVATSPPAPAPAEASETVLEAFERRARELLASLGHSAAG